MTTPAEEVDMMYVQLKPPAVDAAHQYILSRTPERLQSLMLAKIDDDLNPPPDPTHAVVADGDPINVRHWDNSTGPGTAVVAGGSVTNITATPIATKAIVDHNGQVAVNDLADAPVTGSPGTATVAAGALTKVNLTA